MVTIDLNDYRYIEPQLIRFMANLDSSNPRRLRTKLAEFSAMVHIPCVYIYCYAIEKYGKSELFLKGIKSVSKLYGYDKIENFKNGINLEEEK